MRGQLALNPCFKQSIPLTKRQLLPTDLYSAWRELNNCLQRKKYKQFYNDIDHLENTVLRGCGERFKAQCSARICEFTKAENVMKEIVFV